MKWNTEKELRERKKDNDIPLSKIFCFFSHRLGKEVGGTKKPPSFLRGYRLERSIQK